MFTEDLTAFFTTDDFAETIVFEGSNVPALVGASGIAQDSVYPQVLVETKDIVVRTADVGTVVVGQDVTVDTETWRVIDKQDEGGVLLLSINRNLS